MKKKELPTVSSRTTVLPANTENPEQYIPHGMYCYKTVGLRDAGSMPMDIVEPCKYHYQVEAGAFGHRCALHRIDDEWYNLDAIKGCGINDKDV